MDVKEIRNALKQAKESIKNKEYKDALRFCKDVIKADKNNYTALVFIGVSAQELGQNDQALVAFKRAVKENPDQILAWQGLCSFYEKLNLDENYDDLSKVYQRLLIFYENDDEKYTSTILKYGAVLLTMKNYNEFFLSVQQAQIKLQDDVDKFKAISQFLFENLISIKDASTCYVDPIRHAFESLMSVDTTSYKIQQYYSGYLNYLSEIADNESAEKIAKEMIRKVEDKIQPATVLSHLYLQNFCLNENYLPLEIGDVMEVLKQNEDSHQLYVALKLMSLIQSERYEETFILIEQETVFQNSTPEYYYMLYCIHLKVHQYQNCEYFINEAIKLTKREVLRSKFEMAHVRTLYLQGGPNQLIEAFHLLQKMEKTDAVLSQTMWVLIKLDRLDEATEICSQLKKMNPNSVELEIAEAAIFMNSENFMASEALLQRSLTNDSTNSQIHVLFGRLYWKQEKWRESYDFYLKAANLDPYESECFLYIGHYHRYQLNDIKKACKCYRKAHELNMSSEEAASSLSDMLRILEKHEENFNMLQKVTQNAKSGSMKWAFHRLGVHHLHVNDPLAAILSLQNALRADSSDYHAWETLAEAYMAHGSYSAAVKAFTKASELNGGSLYCFFKIGVLKEKLGFFSEAIDQFKTLLIQDPKYVPAMKGLASSLLRLAWTHFDKAFYKLCVSCCQKALIVLSRALMLRPDFLCLWKLAGDVCVALAPISSEMVKISITEGAFRKSGQTADGNMEADKTEILNLGTRCYGQALSIAPNSSSLWHDLGLSYLYQAEETEELTQKQTYNSRALNSLRKAVIINPKSHLLWNSLGVVATKSDSNEQALAQHAFIQSIKLENNNVIAWTNLGLLYLENGNVELGHKALKNAQAIEPSYANCWIAQALVAEKIGHEETMDLFRHSSELSNHPEGEIGYAASVCKFLKENKDCLTEKYKYNIEELSAITAASDAMVNYTDLITNSPEAYNMLGIFQERQSLFKSAMASYKRCLNLMKKDANEKLIGSCLNLARVLSKANMSADALLVYQNLKLENHLQYMYKADAEYSNGDLEKAVATYEQGRDLAPQQEKVWFEIAIALTLYRMGNIKHAKELLLQCSCNNPQLVESHLALCSLGILTSDHVLASTAMQECLPFSDDPKYVKDIALLHCYVSVMQGSINEAKKILSGYIHKFPNNSDLWLLLSSTILQLTPEDSHLACRCTSSATKTGSENQKCYLLLCVSHLAAGYVRQSLAHAQTAIHMFPGDTNLQLCLAVALLSNCLYKSETCCCKYVSKLLLAISKMSKEKTWILLLLSFCYFHLKDYKSAQEIFIQLRQEDVQEHSTFLELISSLSCYLSTTDQNEKHTALHKLTETTLSSNSTLFGWMVLLRIFHKIEKFKEMELLVQKCLTNIPQAIRSPKRCNIPHLQVALLRHASEQGANDGSAMETLNLVLKLDQKCSIAYLLQAVFFHEPKKVRLTNKRLGSTLQQPEIEPLNVELIAARLLKNLIRKNDEDLFKIMSRYAQATNSSEVESILKELVESFEKS